MPKKVRIPTPLRKLTNNEELVEINAATIGEAITELQSRYPGIQERLVDDKGEVRRFVNVYVNDDDIRFMQKEATPVKDGDTVSIVPSIAGGTFSVIPSPDAFYRCEDSASSGCHAEKQIPRANLALGMTGFQGSSGSGE